MIQFDSGEIIKLRNSASLFYHKSMQVFSNDVDKLVEITDYEEAKAHFSKVVMRNDYKINGDRMLVCFQAGIEAHYAILPNDTLRLIYAIVSKFNMSLYFLEDELVRVVKGRVNKFTEILTKVSGFGWIYHQPQNFLPNVFLNQNGGFRSM